MNRYMWAQIFRTWHYNLGAYMKDKEFRKNKEHRERVQTNRYMA